MPTGNRHWKSKKTKLIMPTSHNSKNHSPVSRALWYVSPRQVELKENPLAASCSETEVRVEAVASAISRGTENLVFNGLVPESEWNRMRAPLQIGNFPFPVKYGYAIVGKIIQGRSELLGRSVFTMHPHETVFDVPEELVLPLPEGMPEIRAVLCANMETALNGVWDAGPAPGDRIAVIGAGAVGCLIAAIAGRIPGAEVTLVDLNPNRGSVAGKLGVGFSMPDSAGTGCDIVFHASGNPEGLATAINLAGNEGRIIEMSWFGDKTASLQLGGAFHSRRLRIISSQVGQVAAERRPRWSNRRRQELALSLLNDPRLDILLENRYQFDEIEKHFPNLMDTSSESVCPVILYGDSQ